MSSSSRTLYVGVTTDLRRRVHEHRTGRCKSTRRYRITRLVYWERVGPRIVALTREHQIKRLDRKKRLALVSAMNPRWDDLAAAWFRFPFGMTESFSKR